MRDHLDQFGDALPVVITFTADPARLVAYKNYLDIDFPIVSDVGLVLYEAFGAARGTLRRIWSFGTLVMYAKQLLRGRRLSTSTEDNRQLGADALIDRNGHLHRLWLPESPDARPPIDEIIAAVKELNAH